MQYHVNVKADGGGPLPGAKLVIVSNDGYGNAPVTGDGKGSFVIDTTVYDLSDLNGISVIASADGYQSLSVSGGNMQADNDFILIKNSGLNALVVGALLVGAALLFGSSNRK